MEPRDLIRSIEQLRASRVRPERQVETGPLFRATADEVKKTSRRLGSAGASWAEMCPPDLIGRTAVEGISRGLLTIRVADAASRFQLDRALREGLERELIRRCPVAVRGIRLVVGELD